MSAPARTPRIPFNKPFLSGKEREFVAQLFDHRRFSGDGPYSQWCERFLTDRYHLSRALLTTSCTDALEMIALLLNIKHGDEVILPSYTFPSTANAFALRGATLRFADSGADHPNMNPSSVASLITEKTKAIVCVHYAGMACDMNALGELSRQSGAALVEDAAMTIESSYYGKQLGTIGTLGAFSFHETKNIHCGEGGLLMINDEQYIRRAEILREKGTNRSAFFRGEVDKYAWMDIGSSFLPGEMTAAFLAAQLQAMDAIIRQRLSRWNRYYAQLRDLPGTYNVLLPSIPEGASNNGHTFYLVCSSPEERTALINHLRAEGIQAVFHYQSLHRSPFFRGQYHGPELFNSDRYSDCLVRLPMFNELTDDEIDNVCDSIRTFFRKR
jgi:dTDP-4-amino-4,6-dideoxygalactose transaminase